MSFDNNFDSAKGYGKSVLSSILPSSMKNKFHNLSLSPSTSISSLNESSHGSPVVNLADLVLDYAHKLFKENEREYYKQISKQCHWRDLGKEINWHRFKVKHMDVKYTDIDKPKVPKSNVLFRSTFVNDTINEQEYVLNAERKTMADCSIQLFEGFVNEAEAELSLEVPLPGCVLKAGVGFKTEYTMETVRTKSVQEEMTWSVQSTVRVPAMSCTTAELHVQENEYKGNFEIKTYFKGELSVQLFKDGSEVCTIEIGEISNVFTHDKGFRKDGKGLFRMSRGNCKARFGIDQRIALKQKPLETKRI